MTALVISCSAHPGSKSRALAQTAFVELGHYGANAEFIDMRDHGIPLCDGATTYGHPSVALLTGKIAAAQAVILATPIYNYDANAVAKNLLEHTGRAWTGKVVAFLCAAGGQGSYMSIMGLANSLMLDFRCIVVPRFVYAHDKTAFGVDGVTCADLHSRIVGLCAEVARIGTALAPAPLPTNS